MTPTSTTRPARTTAGNQQFMPTKRSEQRTELYRTMVFTVLMAAIYLVAINWAALRHHVAHLL